MNSSSTKREEIRVSIKLLSAQGSQGDMAPGTELHVPKPLRNWIRVSANGWAMTITLSGGHWFLHLSQANRKRIEHFLITAFLASGIPELARFVSSRSKQHV